MDEPDVFTMLEQMRRNPRRTLRSILFVRSGIGFVFHDTLQNVIPPTRFYRKMAEGIRTEWRRHNRKPK